MSKAYGLSAGCSQAPNSPYWIVDPDATPDATVSSLIGSVPLLQRGELLAWLPIVTGHEALDWCVRWDNTGPVTRERSVHFMMRTSDAILESASKKENAKMAYNALTALK